MYIETVPNRNSPPATLLRESYREGGKVRKRTLLKAYPVVPGSVSGDGWAGSNGGAPSSRKPLTVFRRRGRRLTVGGICPALQQMAARPAAPRANEPIRPPPVKQELSASRLIRKALLKLEERL